MGYPVIGDVRLQQLITDREPWSSFVERFRGGIVTVVRSVDGFRPFCLLCGFFLLGPSMANWVGVLCAAKTGNTGSLMSWDGGD